MLPEHIEYLSDGVRLALYERAVRQIIRPGQRAADLGCGTAVLGMMCVRAGAEHVVAIDETAIIDIARTSVERAGMGDRFSFVRSNTMRAKLPDRVDVVICDHVGYLGFDYGIVPMLRDARARFLEPGGMILPSRIKLSLGAVESPACDKITGQWNTSPVPHEFHWVREKIVNNKHAVNLKAGEIISAAAVLGTIDFREDCQDFLSWSVELPLVRDGIVHGLAGWFDCELAEGIWMTNSPLSPDAIGRPQAFLPIESPVEVRAGDVVKATLVARIDENMLGWVVEFLGRGKKFSHSTWKAMPLMPVDLKRASPSRIPKLTEIGMARLTVLRCCVEQLPAGEIEATVLRDHPSLFPTLTEISKFVAQVLAKDTE